MPFPTPALRARPPRLILVATLAVLGWAACGDLGAIEEGRCGNEVIEPGEDCDTYADLPGAEVCIGLGLPGQCRYSCAPRGEDDDDRFSCPAGWGCGSDSICRRHAGSFGTLLEAGRPSGRWFDVGDFDGDDELDVASISDATLSVSYLERGVLRDGFETPFEAVGLPSVADADVDGRADLLVPSPKGLALFRGTASRVLAPTAFASLRVRLPQDFVFASMDVVPELVIAGDGTAVRFPGDEPLTFAAGSTFAVANALLGVDPDAPTPFVLDAQAQPTTARPVVGTFDESADVHGPFRESPEQVAVVQGDEVVVLRPSYALSPFEEGQALFWIDATFEVGANNPFGPPPPASHPARTVLTSGGVTIERIAATQANLPSATSAGRSRLPCGGGTFAPADEHLDLVLFGAVDGMPRTLIAYGLGDGTFHSQPCALEAVEAQSIEADDAFAVPPNMGGCAKATLALADIDGDGAADVVTATRTHLSGLIPAGQEEALDLCSDANGFAHPDGIVFASAVTGDMDGDGLVDVVAAHTEPGMSVLTTNGEAKLRRISRVTEAPAETLRPGDFDGDGVSDVAFSQARDDDQVVSVLFGDANGEIGSVLEVASFPGLLEMGAADIARGGERDAPQELIFAIPEPDTDLGFRYGIVDGSADRLLQAPFVYATETLIAGQSPDYVPVGAVIAPFDVSCEDELEGDSNPQVLFVTGRRSEGPFSQASSPVSALGAACVDASARFSVAEEQISDLGLASALDVQGTAVIAAEVDDETVPFLVVFAPNEGSRRIELSLPRATTGDGGIRWSRGPAATIDGATVAGGPATIVESPSSPLRAWAPFLNNVPSSCRLWPDAPPAAVFLAVHDDGMCPGDGDLRARTVLHVLPGSTIAAIGEGSLEGALALPSEDDAAILGFACLDVDADPEEEVVVIRALGAIDPCGGSRAGPFSAELRVVDLSVPGQIQLAAPSLGTLSPDRLTQRPGLPPAGGLRAGDFDRDGVDDLFVGTPERSYVWLGRALLP